MPPISYARHQFPPAVIQHAVWLYVRFTLSFREVEVLDVLVQRRRDKAVARRLMRKLLRKQGFAPAVVTTDKLRSYGPAFAEVGLTARHEQGLRKKNRAEVSHQPIR